MANTWLRTILSLFGSSFEEGKPTQTSTTCAACEGFATWPPLSVSALPWGGGNVPAAGKMVGGWENLLQPVPAFYVADNTQIISILSSEAKFLVCMMLFALTKSGHGG